MAEQLFLSYWLRGFTPATMARTFDKTVRLFPFSRLAKSPSNWKVMAIDAATPALLEQALPSPIDLDRVTEDSRHYQAADVALELETWWDLWSHDGDWKLEPARAVITCFGPEFENHLGENLRVDFGIDSRYLPDPEIPGSAHVIQSNIRSLLKLVHDLDDALPVEKRQLWSETGENFVERLQTVLSLSQ